MTKFVNFNSILFLKQDKFSTNGWPKKYFVREEGMNLEIQKSYYTLPTFHIHSMMSATKIQSFFQMDQTPNAISIYFHQKRFLEPIHRKWL
jgi:hypothetical protein